MPSINIKTSLAATTKAGGGTLRYWIHNTMDGEAARDLLLATAPAFYNGAPLADYSIDVLDWQTMEGRVEYKIPSVTPPKEKTGNIFTQLNLSGGSVHITQSLETVASYCAPCLNSRPSQYIYERPDPGSPPTWSAVPGTGYFPAGDGCTENPPPVLEWSETTKATVEGDKALGILVPGGDPPTAPYTGGAIGITKDLVEGCDIDGGPLSFSKRVYLDSLTDDQVKRLVEAKDCCNSRPWRLWDTGQVRFKGATGGDQGRNNVELTLDFLVDVNITDLYIGTIGPISKRAHEYLWVHHKEFEDPVSHTITKKPAYAYVERVYGWSDFSIIDELLTPVPDVTSEQEQEEQAR